VADRRPRSLTAVVLAAGLGKRLRSRTPKVLHSVCGRPVLWHVLTAAAAVRPDRLVAVIHHGAEQVEAAVRSWGLRPEPVFVDQGEPLGTGHAMSVAEEAIGPVADVLVLPGDEPLVTADQVRTLLKIHRRRDVAAVVQATSAADPRGFARVIRDARSELRHLAEGSDATAEELEVTDVATAVYVFRRDDLFRVLPLVGRENRQREYYLPDVIKILRDKGERIAVDVVDNGGSVGANSQEEIAAAAAVMRRRINAAHMQAGVTLVDPDQTYVDVGVRIGPETQILPLTLLEGDTLIGRGCSVGPATRIADSRVGDGSSVQFAVVREARIGKGVSVGPYVSLRPGTVIEDGGKAGTFVEIKASRVGKGSKVPHLSYVGDTVIGESTNIGAGTITVNYDGWEKHRTVIGDDVRIGSNTMLVAPVTVGDRAMTGAGSAITRDVPAGALGIERAEQRNIEGFRDRKEAARDAETKKRGGAKARAAKSGTKGKARKR
jgi:bifunctional UDP-N-acetylglucosamine pyrophosphorylase / glucosamine-1-phosphate N-acetyltransferase